ncbi:MAG: hypothetical protein NTY07_14490 [Bacteroidia bacterium]|nr:hypothetical protein [Bacteroidia bacterium]
MTAKESFFSETTFKMVKVIFFICAVYFFLMGVGLIFLPRFLIKGFSEVAVNPIIIGMLRGAGGSILPYSLLYIMIALNPFRLQWALYIIFLANVTAIALDLVSLLLGEYKLSYAMIDIPIELLSIIGIIIIWLRTGRIKAGKY